MRAGLKTGYNESTRLFAIVESLEIVLAVSSPSFFPGEAEDNLDSNTRA
jgi:hypothetical protein